MLNTSTTPSTAPSRKPPTTPVDPIKDSSTAGTDLKNIGVRLQKEMEKCWHFVNTVDEFKKIRGLDRYYPEDDAVTKLKAIASEELHGVDLTAKESSTYAPLCKVIQATLNEAAKALPQNGDKPMAIRDTSNSAEVDSIPVVRHEYLQPDAPNPMYSINDGFDKKADLVMYRKTGTAGQYFDAESKKRKHDSASTPPQQGNGAQSDFVGKTAWNFIETYIEVKTDHGMRAFDMGITADGKEYAVNTSDTKKARVVNPLPDTEQSRATRGQLAQYAGQIMLRQHRCFVYSVFILQSHARLIYWDRSGAIVSPSFNIRSDSNDFLHFIYALGRADNAHLGHDPTATLVTFKGPEDKQWEAAAQSIKTKDPELYARVEEAGANNWPKYKLLVPGDDCQTATARWDAAQNKKVAMPPANAAREFLVAKHAHGHRSPTGRGCKGYVALDIKNGIFRFLKDFWRTTLPEYPPEWVAYDKLKTARVPNVLTFHCGGDVEGKLATQANVSLTAHVNVQHTIAHTYDKRVGELHDTYQHGRLVVEEVGRELKDYKDSRELATVFFDALTAHKHAWNDAGLLHRDISDRNIVIYKGRGCLIDWDLAKTEDQLAKTPTRRIRSGTWRYMSGLACLYPLKPYELSDDLESFIRVFTVLVLRFQNHDEDKATVQHLIQQLDSAKEKPNGVYTSMRTKSLFARIMEPAEIFCKDSQDKGRSPNLIKLFTELNNLSQEHNDILNNKVMECFLFTAIESSKDYIEKHRSSPLYSHEKLLKVFKEFIDKKEGWVKGDRRETDFFAGIPELASYRTKRSTTSRNIV